MPKTTYWTSHLLRPLDLNTIDDVTWVMQSIASLLKAGREAGGVKRARANSVDGSDEVAVKR